MLINNISSNSFICQVGRYFHSKPAIWGAAVFTHDSWKYRATRGCKRELLMKKSFPFHRGNPTVACAFGNERVWSPRDNVEETSNPACHSARVEIIHHGERKWIVVRVVTWERWNWDWYTLTKMVKQAVWIAGIIFRQMWQCPVRSRDGS